MIVRIVDNHWAYIDNIPISVEPKIVEKFSVRHPRAKYIDVSQAWDGVYRKYDVKRQRIALPLLKEFIDLCNENDFAYEINDLRDVKSVVDKISDVNYLAGVKLEQYQIDAINSTTENDIGLIKAVTGSGKCLGKGTKILMYNGSTKLVENIRVGDVLMGDNSTPRNVLSTCCGIDQLYLIKQKNGDDYVVNQAHILSLKISNRHKRSSVCNDGSVVDINIIDYLNSNKSFKYIAKGYKVPIKFDNVSTPFDPYLFGLWLGGGISKCFSIDNKDVDNINKHIPSIFKFNSIDVRLQVLAGIIDSGGHVDADRGTCNIVIKNGVLADDIVFVARSVGFIVTDISRKRTCTTGYNGMYRSITLSGLFKTPVKNQCKKFNNMATNENQLVCDIRVEPIGIGEYYGFELDGNKRFLLGDFTVTHNTECAAGIIKLHNCRTVVIAEQRIVIEQIKERLKLRDLFDVGLFYGGEMPDGNQIVVGSIQSLNSPPLSYRAKNPQAFSKRLENSKQFQDIVRNAELLIVDEADRCSGSHYKDLFRLYKGRKRYGLSATPFDLKKPVENLTVKERLGSIIYEIGRKAVEAIGRVIPIRYYMFVVGEDGNPNDRTMFDVAEREQMIDNVDFHERVNKIVSAFPNDKTLILVDTCNIEDLGLALERTIKNSVFIYGKTSTKNRQDAIKKFESGEIKCLIGGRILSRGMDIKGGAHNLILCGGGQLWSNLDQKIGRALRINDKGYSRVFGFMFKNSYYLYKHAREQLKAIVNMGYPTTVIFKDIKVDGEQLIKSRFRKPKM
jgi:superfamily II DNA or RNA helicase